MPESNTHSDKVVISEEEAALYDRQIRLWGLDAQKRLRSARILVIGMGGLGAEIVKNLTLTGVKSITLMDSTIVNNSSHQASFLIPPNSEGKNAAEASVDRTKHLNPMVEVLADTEELSAKADNFVADYDIVCATRCKLHELVRLNNTCRENNVKFYAADVNGFWGYLFADLLDHEFAEEITVPKSLEIKTDKTSNADNLETKTTKKTVSFVPLQDALGADLSKLNKRAFKRIQAHWLLMRTLQEFRNEVGRDPQKSSRSEDLEKLVLIKNNLAGGLQAPFEVPDQDLECVFGELSPACAVVGGVLAQEIIKTVSAKDPPIRNFFFFNGATDCSGLVESIGV